MGLRDCLIGSVSHLFQKIPAKPSGWKNGVLLWISCKVQAICKSGSWHSWRLPPHWAHHNYHLQNKPDLLQAIGHIWPAWPVVLGSIRDTSLYWVKGCLTWIAGHHGYSGRGMLPFCHLITWLQVLCYPCLQKCCRLLHWSAPKCRMHPSRKSWDMPDLLLVRNSGVICLVIWMPFIHSSADVKSTCILLNIAARLYAVLHFLNFIGSPFCCTYRLRNCLVAFSYCLLIECIYSTSLYVHLQNPARCFWLRPCYCPF